MASSLKYLSVPANSANLEEARGRVFDLFRMACRSVPSIIEMYTLDEMVTPSQLRSTIASQIRRNAQVTNPKVIDMLVFKGTEELNNIVEHSKQRHHIIGQYVLPQQQQQQQEEAGDGDASGHSPFLNNFYKTNYF
ncbi:hypothetical protein M569_03994 [Genlisea aurea]|uniref:Uncharacterized protein n=1 Tax=Genlisea aurea TaxID=192259 RepID=S8D093_9LAMI|nr:hypothetical protein M569_03994 [Genlisea aurea]